MSALSYDSSQVLPCIACQAIYGLCLVIHTPQGQIFVKYIYYVSGHNDAFTYTHQKLFSYRLLCRALIACKWLPAVIGANSQRRLFTRLYLYLLSTTCQWQIKSDLLGAQRADTVEHDRKGGGDCVHWGCGKTTFLGTKQRPLPQLFTPFLDVLLQPSYRSADAMI